jgi:hypothetical protein
VLWTQISIRAPTYGPNGGVAVSLDQAKAAFRLTWDRYGAFEAARGRPPRSNEELHDWSERRVADRLDEAKAAFRADWERGP